jgi:hypothetical protein
MARRLEPFDFFPTPSVNAVLYESAFYFCACQRPLPFFVWEPVRRFGSATCLTTDADMKSGRSSAQEKSTVGQISLAAIFADDLAFCGEFR